MEIIFVILKVIGILLAILLLLCITLFVVPVRYRVNITVQEEAEGKAAIHWLLHLLDVRIYYKEKKVSYRLRIFGIPLPLGKEKNGRKKGIKAGEKEQNSSGKQENPKESAQTAPLGLDGSPDEGQFLEETEGQGHKVSLETKGRKEAGPSLSEGSPIGQEGAKEGDSPEEGRPPKEGEPSGNRGTGSGKKIKTRRKKRKGQANKGFIQKIKARINSNKHKSKAMPHNSQQEETGREDKASSLREQLTGIKAMVTAETNQAAFFHVLRETRCLLGHYIPGTVSGNLTFSMGNPELTGKALGMLSLLPFWARSRMVIMPDFLSEAFYAKGILYVAGHIRFLHLPVFGIRLLADKNIRKLVKDIRSQLP